MNIVLLGIQGSGKGTVIQNLKTVYDFEQIATGELLRKVSQSGSELGMHIKNTQDSGILVGLDIVINVVKNHLDALCSDTNIIFDSFPRSYEQAIAFQKICKVDLVIVLELSRDEAVARILGRLSCKECGYLTRRTLSSTDICPVCNGALITRSDDTFASIAQRIDIYEKETYPLMGFYKNICPVEIVDASGTDDEVLDSVYKVIKKYDSNNKN